MARPGKTFSESWHRIAGLKVSLRSTVKVRKQYFRGEKWFILQDPFNNSFFRLRPEAYDFVSHLRTDRTVEEVWSDCLERNPEGAPGQEDVLQLLAQLYYANILFFENPADSEKLFERYRRRKQREIQSKFLSIMFMRIPLLDPDAFLNRIKPVTQYFVGYFGGAVWLFVFVAALKMVIDNFDAATEQAQGILAPDNLILLYLGLVFIKTLHEFGHAIVCKHFGGEVHTMGVMLLVFTPLPYMDATSSWAFRSRWQRALVGGAGMLTEIFLAALATFWWAYSGPGVLHSLAYNMMFIASVSTVLFNGNPLLRFDGYYILSDLLDIPNLHTQSRKQLRHLAERYLFGLKDSNSPTKSRKEASWLLIFGVLSGIYRVVVFTGIILFVADKFLLAGLVMAVICIISWGLVPPFRLVRYLSFSPRLARNRVRAVAVCSGIFLALFTALAIYPAPYRFRAPGVVESVGHLKVVNDVSGYVSEILAASGTRVEAGSELIVLRDPELDLEIKATEAQWKEVLAMEQQAESKRAADLEPIRKRKAAIAGKLKDLQQKRNALIVRAKSSGVWVSPEIQQHDGIWIVRGTVIGEIVNPQSFRFSAVVSQNEASNLFEGQIQKAEVRLYGQADENIEVASLQFIPFQHDRLPSAALGWLGGGEVAVTMDDKSGLKTAEPFFQIYARIAETSRVLLVHGRSGKLRFHLNSQPLLLQWARKVRQLLQKRYQI